MFVKVYWPKYTENAESIANDHALKHSLTSPRGKNSPSSDCATKTLFADFYYSDIHN